MFKKDKKDKEDIAPARVPTLSQLFAPDRVKEYEDHIRIDDMYCRLLVVEILPELLCFGWFNAVTSMAGVTVSVTLYPYTQKEANNQVARNMTVVGSDLHLARKRGETTEIGKLETKYAFYYQLLTDINLRRNNLVAATVTVQVTAPTYEQMVHKCNQVKDILGATGVITMYDRQLEGFTNTLPFLRADLKEVHDVTVANAACLSPLLSSDFTHPSGIYFGKNETGSPALLDLFIGPPRLFGMHMFITGATRTGKSYTVKGITSRSMAHGISVVIIDPEGEYRKLVKSLGGVLVKFKPNMEPMFNIFDIEPDEDEETGRRYVDIAGKSEDICQLISSIIEAQTGEKITAEERALAGKAVRDEYLSKEITEDEESIYLPGGRVVEEGVYVGQSYKEMPTITSYVKRLGNMGATRLANIMQPFCRGGGMGFFDGQSIGSFYDNNLVVFDVSSLKTEFQRTYAMYVMLSWVWEKFVKKSKKRKMVVVDEAWLMMRHKDTAKFLSDLTRRGAKYNTSTMVASQSFREFTTEEGQVLMAQCDTKFFLKMQHNDARELGEIFKLPQGVINRIETFQPGQGILRAGLESAIVSFKGFHFEEYFLKSDPEAVLAR
ncbi:VirB4 family type IV secretion system protein [Desulfotruncus arcticus]|uniref:VirB4 family type IV secretion system protein n=1 Tax=Desulfotruncus arcticus TaxID=341036 RepID=UPI001EE43101|nr:ATP-binding protein [Desulfotruncus arcticus]